MSQAIRVACEEGTFWALPEPLFQERWEAMSESEAGESQVGERMEAIGRGRALSLTCDFRRVTALTSSSSSGGQS